MLNRRTLGSLLALAVSLTAIAGCKKKPTELAPVQPGDWFEYKFTTTSGLNATSSYVAKIKVMEQDKDSYRIEGDPNGNTPATVVDKALDAGHSIKNHYVGVLWLPPSARQMGAHTRVGDVKEQRPWTPYPNVWCIWEAGNKPGRYYYEPETGFLVGYDVQTAEGVRNARIQQSSIAGLVR
jgi:hypothetical protein